MKRTGYLYSKRWHSKASTIHFILLCFLSPFDANCFCLCVWLSHSVLVSQRKTLCGPYSCTLRSCDSSQLQKRNLEPTCAWEVEQTCSCCGMAKTVVVTLFPTWSPLQLLGLRLPRGASHTVSSSLRHSSLPGAQNKCACFPQMSFSSTLMTWTPGEGGKDPYSRHFKSQFHVSQILPPSWVVNIHHILSAKSSWLEVFPIPGSQTQSKSP